MTSSHAATAVGSRRIWIQRGLVVVLWLTVFLLWRNYQTTNDLSTTEAGQRFIDAVDAAWWGVLAYIGVYLVRPLVLFPASVLTVMGGLLFGPWLGVAVVVVAANTSAMIAYGVGRLLGTRARPGGRRSCRRGRHARREPVARCEVEPTVA